MKRAWVLTMVLLLSFLLPGCSKPPMSEAEASATPVEVIKVTKSDLQMNYNTSGQIEGSAEATISSKVSGRVTAVKVKMGDHVKKGQVLFQIDAKDASNDLVQSKASLSIAEASYDLAAQALKDAQKSYDRSKALFDSQIISQSEMENAESALVNAKLSLKQAQKQVEQAKINVSSSQADLADYSVSSPVNGLVGEISVDVGEMVSSQADVGTVINIDTVKVTTSVPESVVNRLELDTKVPVEISSLDKSVEGTVAAIAPLTDSQTMGYKVEVKIANPSGEIKPGMSAKINLFTGTLKNVITLPVDAIIEKDGQNVVYIVEDNKAKEIFVEVGVSNDTDVEITEGLEVNQLVVVEGNGLLSDGQSVKVVTGREGAPNEGASKESAPKEGESK